MLRSEMLYQIGKDFLLQQQSNGKSEGQVIEKFPLMILHWVNKGHTSNTNLQANVNHFKY